MGYVLWQFDIDIENGPAEIVDFPIEKNTIKPPLNHQYPIQSL